MAQLVKQAKVQSPFKVEWNKTVKKHDFILFIYYHNLTT